MGRTHTGRSVFSPWLDLVRRAGFPAQAARGKLKYCKQAETQMRQRRITKTANSGENFMNEQTKNELPLGFGMALAMDERAMEAFTRLGETERSRVLTEARNARSKREMQTIVSRIAASNTGGAASGGQATV